jgi:guanosine-3',5'-bis(diphosphate) 3'-pyrophosphohydrolase
MTLLDASAEARNSPLLSANLERALRLSSSWHRHQKRKSSDVPYIQHPVGVAMILDRLGWPEDVVVAGLLHDVVEDTEAILEDLRTEFNENVAQIVAYCSEQKTDGMGAKRAWIDRKQDHIAVLEKAPVEARAVALADKLHNLISIRYDLEQKRTVHQIFNAPWPHVLWYYHQTIERYAQGDPRLQRLSAECHRVLGEIEAHSSPDATGRDLHAYH